MALKKVAFEQEPSTNAAEAVMEREEATVNHEQETKNMSQATETVSQGREAVNYGEAAAAAVTTTTAIAKARTTSVAVADAAAKAKEFQREVAAMKGASDFSFGNYSVFKGNNGEIAETGGDQAVLGRWAQIRMLSWDEHHEVSPGEQGASSKDYVAYSKDGKTIDSIIGEDLKSWVGRSVNDYLEYLRVTEEFANAKSRRFVDIAAALMATDTGDGPIGTVIQVTLSESSIPSFSKYQQSLQDTARCVAMGLPGFSLPEDPFQFYLLREVATKGNNRWTKLKIVSTLPAKI